MHFFAAYFLTIGSSRALLLPMKSDWEQKRFTNPKQLAAKQAELKALQKKVNQLQFSLGYE